MAEEEKDDLVTLVDAEDNEVTFRFLALVEIEEGTFAMLTPADDDGEDEMEVYLFHYDYDEEEEIEECYKNKPDTGILNGCKGETCKKEFDFAESTICCEYEGAVMRLYFHALSLYPTDS